MRQEGRGGAVSGQRPSPTRPGAIVRLERLRCATVREALSAVLDGEAAPLARDRVARHLRRCPGCRRYESDIAALAALVAAAGPDAPPRQPLLTPVPAAEPWRRALRPMLRIAAAAVPLALVGPVLRVGPFTPLNVRQTPDSHCAAHLRVPLPAQYFRTVADSPPAR